MGATLSLPHECTAEVFLISPTKVPSLSHGGEFTKDEAMFAPLMVMREVGQSVELGSWFVNCGLRLDQTLVGT